MLFMVTYKLMKPSLVEAWKAFAAMTEEDDAADAGPNIKIIGRWSDLCGAQGVCICETDDGSAIAAWGANWAPMSEIEVTPVLDDMATRAVLSSKPMYQK